MELRRHSLGSPCGEIGVESQLDGSCDVAPSTVTIVSLLHSQMISALDHPRSESHEALSELLRARRASHRATFCSAELADRPSLRRAAEEQTIQTRRSARVLSRDLPLTRRIARSQAIIAERATLC